MEHPVIASTIRSRIFEIEESRSWERNPQMYADVLATSLATQAIFPYAPEEERARRVFSKLRQAPRLLQAARDNVKEPPGIYAKVGLEALRGVLKFIEQDLPRAFSGVDDLHLLGDLADASVEATDALKGYITYLETDLAPRARASFRLGRERFEKKLKLDEGLGVGVDKLLAIATRELWAVQEEFRRAASRADSGDPLDAWRRIKADHPAPGRAGRRGAAADREAADLHRTPRPRHAPAGRTADRRADAGVLPLELREPVDAGPVRDEADPVLLLRHRRRPFLAGRAPGRAPARLQPRDDVVDLDARGLPGAFRARAAPAAGGVEAAEVATSSRRPPPWKGGRTTASR